MTTLTAHHEPHFYLPPQGARIPFPRRSTPRVQEPKPIALVVDPDDDLRCIFSQMLAQVGYAVVAAGNADDACRLASTAVPTLIVTDLRTRLHDTRLIPAQLRRIPALEWIPMIVSSTWDLPQDRALAESVDAALYTTAPVDFRAIRALAARLIQRPRSPRPQLS